ncbi:MAG: hypothetical protein J6M65_12165 [Eubacterium sp.]|nr:hypothetical protein [Eubacterium sp.]
MMTRSEEAVRVCRKCLIYDAAEEASGEIDKYLARIHPEDLVEDEVFKARIEACGVCEMLMGATCKACGCFVEFRANTKYGTCPKNKWR